MKIQSLFRIGIDEVGRGPIAGPVAVGSFVFLKIEVKKLFKGVKESKQLSEIKREAWFKIIQKTKNEGLVNFAVNFQSEKVIDKKGLSFAVNKALRKSLLALKLKPNNVQVLLDGGLKAPVEYKNQKTIIKGDEKEMVIALASICAKVLRDRYMNNLVKKYPEYSFEKHKGYGTKGHYEAIRKYGVLGVHRKSFLYCYL